MAFAQVPPRSGPATGGAFATTHWSVVLSAADACSADAMVALEKLCQAYWRPLYGYVRRRGHDRHDAEDLTQEFFFRLLQKNYLAHVDPRKGRFRSFLLVAINHFLANEWDKVRTVKRGGRVAFLSFNHDSGQDELPPQATNLDSPEKAFDRRWAVLLLERALTRLQQEATEAGRTRQFEALRIFLTGDRPGVSYAAVAADLQTTEAAAKMAVQRWRRRFGELVRDEVAQTVAFPTQIEDEMRYLYAALGA
jgi:RNA polymerase sigma-70 factor (ECF subfamily)